MIVHFFLQTLHSIEEVKKLNICIIVKSVKGLNYACINDVVLSSNTVLDIFSNYNYMFDFNSDL